MRLAIIRRALVVTAALTLLSIPAVSAESSAADTDLLMSGFQGTIHAGTVQPAQDVPVTLWFVLTCTGTNHVDSTQSIRMNPGLRSIPSDGLFHMGSMQFGLGAGWPADDQACPTGLDPTVGGPFHMTVTSPTHPGHWEFRFSWIPTLTPGGNGDSAVFSGATAPSLSIDMDVSDATPPPNTAPTLHLPADISLEGDTTGGAHVSYTATATDAEDTTAPATTCSPASGSLFALGTSTVSCSATDTGGLQATGSFTVSVTDTTDPTLVGMPGDVTMTTSDPSGATLTFTKPTATDIVDDSPTVSCNVASGSTIPVGDTTVTCTAKDASGNTASDSFTAHVRLASATWEDPAAGGLVVNGSRTVPIKVGLSLDGAPITTGSANVAVIPCDGGAAVQTDPLDVQSNGRWMGHLSTDNLATGCYQVVARANGVTIGSFRMDVRPDSSPASKPASTPKNTNAPKK